MDLAITKDVTMPPRSKEQPTPVPASRTNLPDTQAIIDAIGNTTSLGMSGWSKVIAQLGAMGVALGLLIWLTFDLSNQAKKDRDMFRQEVEGMRKQAESRTEKIEAVHDKALNRLERIQERTCESIDKATEEMKQATKAIKATRSEP